MRLLPQTTVFLSCDLQQRFQSLIWGMGAVVQSAKILHQAARVMGVPVVATEQYPKAFGHTLAEVELPQGSPVFEKTQFSMLIPEVEEHLSGRTAVVLYGIEAHVCVLQTALELRERGFDVYIPLDGVSSQRPLDRQAAIERMRQAGCKITSTESVLFELMGSTQYPHFKAVSAILKANPRGGIQDSLVSPLSAN